MEFSTGTLQLFVRIASIGAFAKAGREFGLSPTATTQRIQTLESELGVSLFHRTTRAVSLSAEGEIFLAHAQRIIASIEDARTDLSSDPSHLSGDLRVTASASFGRRYLAPFIAEFMRVYPRVHLRLELSDHIVDIIEQGFDLALRIGTLRSSSLIARKLADNPRILAASPSYLAVWGAPDKPEDLVKHNCLILGDDRNWKFRDYSSQRSCEIRVSGNLTTNYGEVTTEAALAGAGITLKSRWDIDHLLEQGSLVTLLNDYIVDPPWGLWAVRPPSKVVPPRVRAFIEFMESNLAATERYR